MIFIKVTPLSALTKEKVLINAKTIGSLYPHYTHSIEASEHDICIGTQINFINGNHNIFKESIKEIYNSVLGARTELRIEPLNFNGIPKIGDERTYEE